MSEAVASSPPPQTEDELAEDLQKKLQIQIVDTSDAVQNEAVDRAERYLSEETTQRGVAGFLKRVWQGNIARDFYRQREIQRGRQEIVETNNIYINTGGSQADHDQAMAAVVERFTSDFVHEGENNQQFEDVEHGQQLLGQLQELVSTYASGDIDHDVLVEERTRILSEYGQQVHQADRNRGLVYADNILEVASNARAAFEHGAGLDRIDAAIGGQIGEARTGVRTEARLQVTDRAIDWMHRHHMSGVNETTLALGVAVVMTTAKFTTRKAITSAAALAGLGVGAGLIAAGREHLRVGQERTSHSRQMAEGGEIQDESRRREQMEETRYETVSAADLTTSLQAAREAFEAGDTDSLDELIATATATRARIHASDVHSIDLLEYSSKASVETERLALDIELARARVAIQEAVEANGRPLDLDALQASIHELIVGDISAKDRAFNRLRRNRTIKMGLIGAATGMLAGLGIQEIHSLLDGGLQGVTEAIGGSNRHSLLADLFRGHANHGDAESHRAMFEGGHHFHDVGVNLPEGYHLVDARPGEKLGWDIMGPGDKPVIHGVEWDTQGNLSVHTRDLLKESGFHLTQSHDLHFHEPHLVTSSVERSPSEYLSHHPSQFTRVHRELWYDNNTPGIYDHNELKLWWGGSTGSGIDSHGNYVFNVAHMNPDGSYHEGLSTNAQQLIHDGKIKLALSMTKDTQSHVFMVDVDANGNATIPHDSYIGRSLFENQNGHAHFTGAFAEASQQMGTNPDGSENVRMLATVVGDNNPNQATDIIHHVVNQEHTHYITNIEAPQETPIEIPPVLPIYSRRGLETLAPGEEPERGYGYYGYASPTRERRWARERSPRLRETPEADLDTGEELSWYRSELERRRGSEYLREIDANIAADPVLSTLGSETKALVCIPVAAANEAENIYNSLSLYAQQGNEATASSAIVLNLNWFERLESEPEQLAKINQTREEIKRAQRDFPQLHIAVFEKKWSDEFIAERDGHIYGEVIKVLYDTATLAIEQAIKDKRRESNQEAILITNDADSEGLRRDYLDRYIRAMENNPTVDVFSGLVRGDTKEFKDFPGFGLTNGIYYVMDMMHYREEKRRGTNGISTPGANSAFRLSAFAAVGGCEDSNDQGVGADAQLGRRVMAGRRVPARGLGYGGTYGYSRGSTSGGAAIPNRKISLHVNGAQIDSMGDRLLGAYRANQFIAKAWDTFDDGGYVAREDARGNSDKEDPRNDMDTIVHRIELNVEGFATNWYPDPAAVSSALALYFGTQDTNGNPLYTSQWQNGEFMFRFTDAGKAHLQKVLQRDTRGRFDPYGRRVRRRIYNELPPRSTRPLRVATPRFVAHTA